MEEESCSVSVRSMNNGEPQDDVEGTFVNADSPSPHKEDLDAVAKDEVIKEDAMVNIMEEKNLEELQHPDPDESSSGKTEEQVTKDNNEESGALVSEVDAILESKELNGELENLENSVNETLQIKVEQQESQQENEEDSKCDIVRRSIRNRKPIDNRQLGVVKQTKTSKESVIKKSKKPSPMIGSNSESNKRISSQIDDSRVSGLGTLRTRKKAQRKREKNLVGNLRGGVANRADPSPRPSAMAAPLTCAEYAQCLGLQPAVKFKCHKCGGTNFASIGMLREHQAGCHGVVGVTSEEAAACATLAASGSNLHITQKLILCSACDTYFESWDLFLHMQSVHRRHICLFCLAMFSRAERLACHLGSAHGASEAAHPTVDAFRSSRQSPCLLVCCTCERIFSDGDQFFDHSCRSGGFAGSSTDNVGGSPGGGSSDGKTESSSGGKCGDGASRGTDSTSETTGGDCLRNSNSNQGTAESEGDCTVNNAANLCQLHIRVAAKKELKRKDNVLVVIFERGEQNSDQMLMRVESNGIWETDADDNLLPDEGATSADKSNSDESMSQEGDSKHSSLDLDNVNKNDDKIAPQKSVSPETIDSAVQREESDGKTPEIENGPKSDIDESSSDGMDKIESEGKGMESPESVQEANNSNDKNKQMDSDVQSEGEMVEKDNGDDQSLSEMSEDSRDEMSEKPLPATDSGDDAEICEDNVISKSGDSLVKFDIKDQSCPDITNNNLNGDDNTSESAKLLKEENELHENSTQSDETNGSKPAQLDDEHVSNETSNHEVQTKQDNQVISQQNGIASSPSLANTSIETVDTLDDSGGIQLAGDEVPLTTLHLEKNLKDYSIQDLLKEAVKAACFSCVYCTHAKKIAVNGKQLAFHLLAEHRFQPVLNSTIKNEENDRDSLDDSALGHICVEKFDDDKTISDDHLVKKDSVSEAFVDEKAVNEFVDLLKNSLEQLESSCFNCDSYDNSDTSASKVFSKSYECFQCRFATGLHKELYIHNRKMHQKTNLLCIMCKCTFYSYSELLCHLCPGVYVPNERPKFRCCFCAADSLPSAFRFMVHLRKRHHACDVCLEVTGDQQRLSGHVWKHKLNHLCYRCDIAYRNKPDITKHLFWKHGTESVLCKRCLQKKWPHVYHFCVPPAVFTCEECGSTFSRAVALRVHRRLHLGEAPHACPECGQHFISKRLVTRHQEIKHGELVPKQTSDVLSDSENIAVDSKIHPDEGSLDQVDLNDSRIKKELKSSSSDKLLKEEKLERKNQKINDGNYPRKKEEMPFCDQELNNGVSAHKKEKNRGMEHGEQTQRVSVEKDAKPAKKVVDVMDLPPLNLSSESDDSDEETAPVKSQTMEESAESKIHSDEEKQNQANCSPQQQEEEETKPVEVVDGIWDNFKTYAATLEDPKSQLGETTSEESKGALLSEDIGLMARIIKAEHDYCFPSENVEDHPEQSTEESEPKVKDAEETKDKEQEDGFDHNYCSNNSKADGSEIAQSSEVQEASPKKHPKSPKKRKKTGSGSSSSEASDSSDSDSSSCSCGTNCSCSSSSSSSASSSSASDSDSSASGRGTARTPRREKRKEGKRKKHLGSSSRPEEKVCSTGEGEIRSPGSLKDGSARVDTVVAEEESPPLREVMIRESDLETEESETDEDFYDEQPRRFHGNSAAAMALARLATGNSPSTAPLDDSALPSPATSVQSPASRPPSPTTSLQWKPAPPTPSTPVPPLPPPVPVAEPEVRNSVESISEGFTPLIQPKKRGRKRKRPHLPTKFARKQAENEKCSSDQVPNLCLKVGKTVRRHKVVTPHHSYKNTSPVDVHSVHNSAGAILNSSVIHSSGEPTTPTSLLEGDDGLRLSKRKRVPKRFYGDSSDEDGESGGGGNTSGGVGVSGSSKFTIVFNQSGKVPKKKKSSLGPGSSVSYSRETPSRSSIDGVSHLQRPVYQSQDDVDDQEINMSSDRDEDESQNGRSEGESEVWSGDEGGNEEGSSCTLPSAPSPRTGSQIPGESVGANTGSLYCYCQCPYDEVSEMIACDGKKCAIEWFHFECVGIMVPPKGKWYCPDCRKRCGSSGRTSDHLSGT